MAKTLPFNVCAPWRELGVYYYQFQSNGTGTPTENVDPANCVTAAYSAVGTYTLTVDGYPHPILAAWVNMRDPEDSDDKAYVDAINLTTGVITVKTWDESGGALKNFDKVLDVFIVIGRSA